MRSARLALLILTSALGCGARSDLVCGRKPCEDAPIPIPVAPLMTDERCDRSFEMPPPCEGSGLIFTVPDECIDDSGSSDENDRLDVYCVEGIARFCLSHEDCPWRDGESTLDTVTCSTSGLSTTHMATAISDCAGWEGFDLYCCSPEGRIEVGKQ